MESFYLSLVKATTCCVAKTFHQHEFSYIFYMIYSLQVGRNNKQMIFVINITFMVLVKHFIFVYEQKENQLIIVIEISTISRYLYNFHPYFPHTIKQRRKFTITNSIFYNTTKQKGSVWLQKKRKMYSILYSPFGVRLMISNNIYSKLFKQHH